MNDDGQNRLNTDELSDSQGEPRFTSHCDPQHSVIEDCNLREEVASIIEQIAAEGLPGPRDLDVALDAIFTTIDAKYIVRLREGETTGC